MCAGRRPPPCAIAEQTARLHPHAWWRAPLLALARGLGQGPTRLARRRLPSPPPLRPTRCGPSDAGTAGRSGGRPHPSRAPPASTTGRFAPHAATGGGRPHTRAAGRCRDAGGWVCSAGGPLPRLLPLVRSDGRRGGALLGVGQLWAVHRPLGPHVGEPLRRRVPLVRSDGQLLYLPTKATSVIVVIAVVAIVG